MQKSTHLLATCAVALALAACGGGGDDTPPAPVAPSTTALQGLWQSTATGSVTSAAMVLPDGRMWLVTTDTTNSPASTRLVKARLVGTAGSAIFSGTGTRHFVDRDSALPIGVTVSANVVEKATLNGGISGITVSEGYNLAYLSRYDTPAVLADHAGTWTATLGPGVVTWAVNASGALSGTRTTGCTYTGQISLRPEQKALVEVAIAENCAGSLTTLSGVGALSADKGRLSLFLTSAGEASAAVISLAR
jgi:hypothetical protein